MVDINMEINNCATYSQEFGISLGETDGENNLDSCSSEVEHIKSVSSELSQSQDVDSNLENSENSKLEDIIQCLNKRIIHLQEEIHRLKSENEDLKEKYKDTSEVDSGYVEKPFIKVYFEDTMTYSKYKEFFLRVLKNIAEYEIKNDNNEIVLKVFKHRHLDSKECATVDHTELESEKVIKKKKRKRKAKDEVVSDNFFVVDTTPSLSTQKDTNLKYESKFTVLENSNNKKEESVDPVTPISSISNCFNCNQNHNLRDCPLPRDSSKINAARQKFRNYQTKMGRYHLEDDQKYGHFKPGRISDSLRKALGLHKSELPRYIYKMRVLGYPPGWLEEAQVVQSDLTMYDFDGKNVITRNKKKPFVDPEKIIDYPGFNVPLEDGTKDDYRIYNVPRYSEQFSKTAMLDYIKKLEKEAEDNLNIEDMELESIVSDKDKEVNSAIDTDDKKRESPSLTELESKKNQLLAELNDNTNGSTTSGITIDETPVEEICEQRTEIELEKSVAKTETVELELSADEVITSESVEQTMEVVIKDADEPQTEGSSVKISDAEMESIMETSVKETLYCDDSVCPENEQINQSSSVVNADMKVVKTSAFGTPILKSASPYSKLPKPENFSKDISDVINFENLPNSTGKYEQMTGVLQKVRKVLKNLQEKKS